MQTGRYLNFHQYLYLLRCMSPDVTDILSRMQINCLKTVQLVGVVDTCVVCFIVALDCVLFTCLRSFVLLLFMFSRTGHTYLCIKAIANAVSLVDSHLDIFAPFSLWAALMHIHDVCVYQLLVATVTTSRSGCRCIL